MSKMDDLALFRRKLDFLITKCKVYDSKLISNNAEADGKLPGFDYVFINFINNETSGVKNTVVKYANSIEHKTLFAWSHFYAIYKDKKVSFNALLENFPSNEEAVKQFFFFAIHQNKIDIAVQLLANPIITEQDKNDALEFISIYRLKAEEIKQAIEEQLPAVVATNIAKKEPQTSEQITIEAPASIDVYNKILYKDNSLATKASKLKIAVTSGLAFFAVLCVVLAVTLPLILPASALIAPIIGFSSAALAASGALFVGIKAFGSPEKLADNQAASHRSVAPTSTPPEANVPTKEVSTSKFS